MKIVNQTSKKILSETAIMPSNPFLRAKGMLGYKNGICVILNTRFGIHTIGMKYPIDLLVLNNKKRVVFLKIGLKPNRVFLYNPIYKKVIELPKDSINRTKTKINDIISIK